MEPDRELVCDLEDGPVRGALAESLVIFQIGETGDGSTLQKWAALAFNRVRKLIPQLEYEIQILLSTELIARAY